MNRFAEQPKKGHYAVIFSRQRNAGDDQAYGETAQRMSELAATMPGYLGAESASDDSGFGITVSYWESEAAIKNWRANAEHSEARRLGNSTWYEHFELRIAKIERAYCGPNKK